RHSCGGSTDRGLDAGVASLLSACAVRSTAAGVDACRRGTFAALAGNLPARLAWRVRQTERRHAAYCVNDAAEPGGPAIARSAYRRTRWARDRQWPGALPARPEEAPGAKAYLPESPRRPADTNPPHRSGPS